MSTKELRSRLQSILKYLGPHWEFVNCHMVNFITSNHWEGFVPANVRQCVGGVRNVDKCIEEVFWKSAESSQFENVHVFYEDSKRFRLEHMHEVLTSLKEINSMLETDESRGRLSIKEFMTEKKQHEVEITAQLVHDLIAHRRKKGDTELYIIDAGDGKGYLSSRLALQFEHKVLGIDFSESNSENALERSKKLQRAWNGLTERAELQSQGITPPRRGKKQKTTRTAETQPKNYQTTNKFITTQLDFIGLVKEFFPLSPDASPSLCITGLHTCGNLAATCLKAFASQSDFQLLCNIGCCYHLLREEFSTDEFFGNKEIMDKQSETGFPMSEFLRSKNVKIGRNARMLAAQSIHRSQHAKELPNKSLFYRALLEVLIVEKDPSLKDTVQVGRIKNFNSFKEYVELCNKKANLGLEVLSDEYLRQVEDKYSDQAKYLELFYLIRMCFAPVLESLILLDRLLYLREQGFDQSYLIPLFDPVISPRHFCIVAIK